MILYVRFVLVLVNLNKKRSTEIHHLYTSESEEYDESKPTDLMDYKEGTDR